MNSKELSATMAVFADLRSAERARNNEIRCGATLIATMVEASEHAELRFDEGQDALEHAHRALTSSIEGRRHTVLAHGGLARLAGRRGFDWRMAGDNGATLPPADTEPARGTVSSEVTVG